MTRERVERTCKSVGSEYKGMMHCMAFMVAL